MTLKLVWWGWKERTKWFRFWKYAPSDRIFFYGVCMGVFEIRWMVK